MAQITIDKNLIGDFSKGAEQTLEEQVKKYAEDIINEAALIEESMRENGAQNEITSNIVLMAVHKHNNRPNKKARNGLMCIKIVSTISLTATGFLFVEGGYTAAPVRFVAFIFTLIVACVTTSIQYVLEAKE